MITCSNDQTLKNGNIYLIGYEHLMEQNFGLWASYFIKKDVRIDSKQWHNMKTKDHPFVNHHLMCLLLFFCSIIQAIYVEIVNIIYNKHNLHYYNIWRATIIYYECDIHLEQEI